MTQRFIELQVSRAIYTDVTIAIDDEDPKYKTLFAEDGSLTFRGASLLKEAAAKAADNVAESYDWQKDTTETEIDAYHEVSVEEARQYKIWDTKNDCVLK